MINSACLTGQSEIESACDLLFKKAESIDYHYDVHDQAVEGLLILPFYGSMPTGMYSRYHVLFLEIDLFYIKKMYIEIF